MISKVFLAFTCFVISWPLTRWAVSIIGELVIFSTARYKLYTEKSSQTMRQKIPWPSQTTTKYICSCHVPFVAFVIRGLCGLDQKEVMYDALTVVSVFWRRRRAGRASNFKFQNKRGCVARATGCSDRKKYRKGIILLWKTNNFKIENVVFPCVINSNLSSTTMTVLTKNLQVIWEKDAILEFAVLQSLAMVAIKTFVFPYI